MKNKPNYLFETSWEVCNKVGGIYTVLSTKVSTAVEHFHDQYICIGPDLPRENNPDFVEDPNLFKRWKEEAIKEGLKIRIGRWNVSGNPVVILVDFTPYFSKKDDIFTSFWLDFKLDSISGQWDYIEPALFGYGAGKVIESFYNYYCNAQDHILAHFHEWMTGTGILYLKKQTPQIGTIFTTHATALGRSIAGNLLPLYDNIEQYSPIDMARNFNIQSKFSLEYLSATESDVFTTVSEITNVECRHFFDKPVDVVTINGFENSFVPEGEEYTQKRAAARAKILQIVSALTQQEISEDALLVINSGRYEFKNKGIDLFIDAVAQLKKSNLDREVVACIAVPAGCRAPKLELLEGQHFVEPSRYVSEYTTHYLADLNNDPIVNHLKKNELFNSADSKVKVLFVPVYLDGHDQIFNLNYYDFLIGFDLSVFPSYYEPWGYTPLESIAFGIPTVTTTLAGFGRWIKENFTQHQGVTVVERTDTNDTEVVNAIAEALLEHSTHTPKVQSYLKKEVQQIAQKALWEELYDNYLEAYDKAIQATTSRYELYHKKVSQINLFTEISQPHEPSWTHITVKSKLTLNLKPLEEIAQNLWWSWNIESRELFEEIAGKELWDDCGENPISALQRLSYERIQQFDQNEAYLEKVQRVYRCFQEYIHAPRTRKEGKIAFFSMEFGISNELKIFSGGLGMLAGDYLKEASDSHVDMVGVGLLYRYGYFTQQIGHQGDQINLYPPQSYSKLPITPFRNEDESWKMLTIPLPGRTLYVRIWKAMVGRVPLYLMDTDFNDNIPEDRAITSSLYGGNLEIRLKQEILLGIGGVRFLREIGEDPVLYHMNEGHAAFLGIERLSAEMKYNYRTFKQALELVRASTLFTTHTPVPAGHDKFSEDMIRVYLSNYPQYLNISWEAFMGLGRVHVEDQNEKFSMSILACKLAQEINGVSRIHGRVSREMFANLYEGHYPNELHIGYVTNGVHYPTWTHKKWQHYHNQLFGKDFAENRANPELWKPIYKADDEKIWGLKEELRKELMDNVKELLTKQMINRNESPSLIHKTVTSLDDKTLTVGFARRFATYKRAHLLMMNEQRLAQLVNHPEYPIRFIFAGKAHPHDKAGQDLIKRIIEFSRKEEFIGKIIFLENYDMILAKKLVSGCDIWLNNPTRPLEASGTSGEKAVMNGVLNFSVMDGWWAEGYKEGAGWALEEKITYENNHLQDELDAHVLYSIFQDQIIPTFYTRNKQGIPEGWVQMMKENFYQIAPHYTMKRQLEDYYVKFYNKLEERTKALRANNTENLNQLISWKERVITEWDNIEFVNQEFDNPNDFLYYIGEDAQISVQLRLGMLQPQDVKIELCVLSTLENTNQLFEKYELAYDHSEDGVHTYKTKITASYSGSWKVALRLQPNHPLLPHDFDFHLVKWLE